MAADGEDDNENGVNEAEEDNEQPDFGDKAKKILQSIDNVAGSGALLSLQA